MEKIETGRPSTMQYFFGLLSDHGYHEFHRFKKGTRVVSHILFAHPKALDLLFRFPHVLIMDVTYETNKYELPLLEIIGVTPTNENFHVAFAFIKDERTKSFMWVIKQLQLLFECCEICPKVIVTHRELPLMKAVERYFPNAKHLLCKRHILKNVEKFLVKTVKTKKFSAAFGVRWRRIVDAITWEEYTLRLQELEDVWSRLPVVINYIKNEWLDPYKDRFVTAWTKLYKHFGNEMTNRVESTHSQLKWWLGTTATWGFDEIFPRMHSFIELQLNDIKIKFESSRNVAHPLTRYTLFRQLNCKVSHSALQLISMEFETRGTIVDAEECGCLMRLSYGLPCGHELCQMMEEQRAIHPQDIHIFWRTLHMERGDGRSLRKQSGNDLDMEGDDAPFVRRQSWDEKVRTQSVNDLLKSLFDEIRQTKSDIEKAVIACKMQKSMRAVKQQKDRLKRELTEMDLSALDWECTETTCSTSQRSDSVSTSGQSSGSSSSSRGSMDSTANSYYDMPSFILPFIEDYINVKGDGNCGFRVIASFEYDNEDSWDDVRYDLMIEMTDHFDLYYRALGTHVLYRALGMCDWHRSPAPVNHRLSMIDMGLVIATRYQKIVTCFTRQGCNTYLPLESRINGQQQPCEQIDFGFVGGSHFIKLKMPDFTPMPPVYPGWESICDRKISHWKMLWMQRKQMFAHLWRIFVRKSNK